MRFRPKVKVVVPNREFRSLARVGLPGIFDGEHIVELTARTWSSRHFVQRERFRGLFVPFLSRRLEKDVRRGFDEMNRALRTRALGPPEDR